MASLPTDLPRGWLSAGGCDELWGDLGTYQQVKDAALPPLYDSARFLARLATWTNDFEPLDVSEGLDWHEGTPLPERLAPLLKEAQSLGLAVPPAFVNFLSSPALIARVPSCTACYLDVPNRLLEVPGGRPGRLLRFLSDQQVCALWYLHLTPGGGASVVVGWPEFKDDDGGSDWLDDACVVQGLMQCAPDFETFLHRFWLENATWFALTEGTPLTEEQQRYVAAVKAAR